MEHEGGLAISIRGTDRSRAGCRRFPVSAVNNKKTIPETRNVFCCTFGAVARNKKKIIQTAKKSVVAATISGMPSSKMIRDEEDDHPEVDRPEADLLQYCDEFGSFARS